MPPPMSCEQNIYLPPSPWQQEWEGITAWRAVPLSLPPCLPSEAAAHQVPALFGCSKIQSENIRPPKPASWQAPGITDQAVTVPTAGESAPAHSLCCKDMGSSLKSHLLSNMRAPQPPFLPQALRGSIRQQTMRQRLQSYKYQRTCTPLILESALI